MHATLCIHCMTTMAGVTGHYLLAQQEYVALLNRAHGNLRVLKRYKTEPSGFHLSVSRAVVWLADDDSFFHLRTEGYERPTLS